MTALDLFFWWSGLLAWGCAGIVGFFLFFDEAMDLLIVANFWSRREFMAFVADRLKRKRDTP